VMHLFGLHGKSFIPLIMGFGCNVPAIMATRTLENRSDRILTMLIVPFMSCSARLPVYVLIAGAVFPQRAGNVIFMLYLFGIIMSLLISILFNKILFRKREAPFVMELPVYRNPGMRVILKHMWRKGQFYLKKMGGVILVASLVIWALGYFPRNVESGGEYDRLISRQEELLDKSGAGNGNTDGKIRKEIDQLRRAKEEVRQENSLIGRMGKAIEPVISPLGFDWKMGVSLLSGFAAKEIVVSTMGVLYQADSGEGTEKFGSLPERIHDEVYTKGPLVGKPVFTPLVGISFLIFVLLYLPCLAVITAVGRESGSWKWAGFVLFYTTALAWLASFVVFQAGSLLQLGCFI
ncbi:MAG: ferrous iron transporter B, partial [Bacteroidetes bacterium]